MQSIYLDTSALAKRYNRREIGIELVDAVFKWAAIGAIEATTSLFTLLELTAMASRLLKGKILSQTSFEHLMNRINHDLAQHLLFVPFESEQTPDLLPLVAEHALRAPDAIQLYAAIAVSTTRKIKLNDLIFLADDQELCEAAGSAGFTVIKPQDANAVREVTERIQS